MAIQIKSAANSANIVANNFEASLNQGERIIAFNLNPSSSQEMAGDKLQAKGDKKQKTLWTSTASSFMFGERGAFVDSKVLVAAHLWDGTKYITAPLYGKDKTGTYKVLSEAKPTGLAGEMYGYYIATLESTIDDLNTAMDSITEQMTEPNCAEEELANLGEQLETLMAKQEELEQDKKDLSNFFSLCENVQKKFDIPGLSREMMMAAWAAMSRKQPKVLKLKVGISYDIQDSFDIHIKVISFVIEDGHLLAAQRGQAINNEDSEALRDLATVHFQETQSSAKGIVAKAISITNALQSTVKEGNAATKRKNEFRKQQKARAEQLKAALTLEAKEQLDVTSTSAPTEVEDLNALDLDAILSGDETI